VKRTPFKYLFCQRFGCSPEDFEERAFQEFLYGHARLFAPVLRAVKPDFFLEEFEFIRYLGDAVDERQVKADVLDFKNLDRKHWRWQQTGTRRARVFHRRPRFKALDRKQWRWLHTGLRIRVSYRKARLLAFQLFRETHAPGVGQQQNSIGPRG
jgi:hypothetical protein